MIQLTPQRGFRRVSYPGELWEFINYVFYCFLARVAARVSSYHTILWRIPPFDVGGLDLYNPFESSSNNTSNKIQRCQPFFHTEKKTNKKQINKNKKKQQQKQKTTKTKKNKKKKKKKDKNKQTNEETK